MHACKADTAGWNESVLMSCARDRWCLVVLHAQCHVPVRPSPPYGISRVRRVRGFPAAG